MKLALGTAQFGLTYGVANATGQVTKAEVKKIMIAAKIAGINTLDTAMNYGDSEEYLGEVGVNDWSVITKLPGLPSNTIEIEKWVNNQLERSFERLGISKVYGLMFHKQNQLLDNKSNILWKILNKLKNQGLIEKIGYSVYEPIELERFVLDFPPDIIQAPYSILDRRLKQSGWLSRLRSNGTEIHARSVFMQGLLLMDKKERPKKFNRWENFWLIWEQFLKNKKLSALEACLSFVNNEKEIDKIVVGVDSLKQFNQILKCRNFDQLDFPRELEKLDINLLNIPNWNNL